jgi:glucose/arabinose dehydrogenase
MSHDPSRRPAPAPARRFPARTRSLVTPIAGGAAALLLAACGGSGDSDAARGDGARAGGAAATSAAAGAPCPAGDNGGITLPAGFCATVVADSLGHARHAVVAANGDVYVNTWSGPYYTGSEPPAGGFLVALRDTNRDGRADTVARFGPTAAGGGTGGTGIAIHGNYLYAEAGPRIVRYALTAGQLVPSGRAETVVDGFPTDGDHPQHNFAIDSSTGSLYANMGSATNSCQVRNRTEKSPGRKPCTETATRAGIWRFDANRTGQRFAPGARYATGIRNAVGLAVDPSSRALFATQHGRDQLAENWRTLYEPAEGQEAPAEEMMRVTEGGDFGWPTCYYDPAQRKRVLAPEYGGDGGQAVGDCASKAAPAATFPAHWAPNALVFYTGQQFPARFRNGAFVAFHGSWNRLPGPQGGYNVSFVPRTGDGSFGAAETFADGFAGANKQPDAARHRPTGLAQSADGALYVTDDKRGTVWRITYRGE